MKILLKSQRKMGIIMILGLAILFQANYAGTSGTPVVLKAMEEEVARAMQVLGKKGNPPPYFISCQITENIRTSVSASNGALKTNTKGHSRLLDVDVRVGSHKLDNTHAIRGDRFSSYSGGYSQPVRMSLEDDADSIKSAIWLETDKKYKTAVEKLIRIKANKGVSVKEEDQSDDFSKETARQYIAKPAALSPDMAAWGKRVKEYSAMFNKHPEIYDSSVMLWTNTENKYFVTSEGTSLLHDRNHCRLRITAGTKAEDGMELSKGEYFDARTLENLPDDNAIRAAVQRVIKDILALRKAPAMEPYTGPAILSGRASAVFFHEIFGHRIEGHRQKDESEGQTFTKMLNKEVLPTFISVYDDPSLKQYGKTDLNGHYIYDDEGVKTQRVDVVEKGILKRFLMSRSPIKGFPRSNGHGRKQVGLRAIGRQGNLVVESSNTVPWEKLRQKLIDECKAQGKTYGLLFDDITGGFTNTRRFRPEAFNVTPIMVYRVYVDGRPDELVRGVNLIGTPLTSFSKIIACGRESGVFNGFCGAESGSVPASAISPPILTTQIEVQKKFKASDKPPVLSPPERKLTGEQNKQDRDIIVEAMKDELNRSMASLKIEKMEKPYYMEYSIGDTRQWQIAASFGSLTRSEENHRRQLKVGIRVGSYQLDNSGFLSRRGMFAAIMGRFETIALEDDYNAIRNSIWRLTDRSYKEALEVLAAKKAFLKNQVREEEIPDFSREKSVEQAAACKTITINREKWEKIIKNLSAVFRQFPGIHKSSVKMEVNGMCKYFVNSEGTVFRQPETLVSLAATASTQAADGMKLKHYIPFYTSTIEALPDEKELTAKIRKMAEELTALAAAPVLDEYIGPVLFTQQASAELFTQLLVPNLSGQRPPLSETPQYSGMFSSSKLAQRLNRKVLPRGISILDDPTRSTFEGKPLMGSYSIDDEGVAARPVTLVEKGTLKTLLMSRRPRKEILNSNGHGRAALRGNAGVQIGNLLITTDNGKTYQQLKDELIQLCKDQQLSFGLIIKTVDNPSITGVDRSSFSLFTGRGQDDSPITSPVLMYKVYAADGREELVRGISVGELDVGDLKDIAGVGSDYYVHHRMLPTGGLMGSLFSIFFSSGGSSMGVPTSITAPSVMFEEIEFKKSEKKKKKPPLLTHPFFSR